MTEGGEQPGADGQARQGASRGKVVAVIGAASSVVGVLAFFGITNFTQLEHPLASASAPSSPAQMTSTTAPAPSQTATFDMYTGCNDPVLIAAFAPGHSTTDPLADAVSNDEIIAGLNHAASIANDPDVRQAMLNEASVYEEATPYLRVTPFTQATLNQYESYGPQLHSADQARQNVCNTILRSQGG